MGQAKEVRVFHHHILKAVSKRLSIRIRSSQGRSKLWRLSREVRGTKKAGERGLMLYTTWGSLVLSIAGRSFRLWIGPDLGLRIEIRLTTRALTFSSLNHSILKSRAKYQPQLRCGGGGARQRRQKGGT